MKNRVQAMMRNYQSYYGIQGKNTKSGCGFYVKKEIKYKPKKPLEVCFDENDKFRSVWIKKKKKKKNNNNKKTAIVVGVFYRYHLKNPSIKFNKESENTQGKIINNNKMNIKCGRNLTIIC